MGFDFKKNEKLTKIITIILIGLLIVIAVGPLGKSTKSSITPGSGEEKSGDSEGVSSYYEQHLKSILESSYGADTMDVMVHVKASDGSYSFYGNNKSEYVIDGVLIVADVNDANAVSDITFAVCALFDLPAHKVAVIVKK